MVNLADAHFNRDGPAYQRVLSGRAGGRRQTAQPTADHAEPWQPSVPIETVRLNPVGLTLPGPRRNLDMRMSRRRSQPGRVSLLVLAAGVVLWPRLKPCSTLFGRVATPPTSWSA